MNQASVYPYRTFNTTGQNYTGPIFGNFPYTHLWTYLSLLKSSCLAAIGPGSYEWTHFVSECCVRNLSSLQQANLQSYSYMLSLWPASVALFASLGPDAGDAAYDNVGWAVILALTSGAMEGLRSTNVPHHVKADSYETARNICESADRVHEGHKTGRYSERRRKSSPWLGWNQWVLLLLCFGLWAGFVVSFTWGLSQAFFYSHSAGVWNQQGAVWYYLACVPALLQAICRLAFNNVELFEPIRNGYSLQSDDGLLQVQQAQSGKVPTYRNVSEGANGVQVWRRVVANQICGRPYRLLVRPAMQSWKTDVYRYVVMLCRFALLIVGSIEQGEYFLYPPDIAIAQSIILVFLTTSPRALWPIFWVRDRRGADLVVFYKTLEGDCLDC